MLRFGSLELVEHQVAERIEDDARAPSLPRLGDVRMMADHHARAGIDRGMGELDLLGIGVWPIFGACVHGDNGGVGLEGDGDMPPVKRLTYAGAFLSIARGIGLGIACAP